MRKNILKYLLLLVTINTLSGCYNPMDDSDYGITKGKHHFWTPAPPWLRIPEGDDSYSQGVRDGCNTFLETVGETGLKMHNFAYDVNRGIEDRDYYIGFRMGMDYCTYYVDVDPL